MTGSLMISPNMIFHVEVPHYGHPQLPTLHTVFLRYRANPAEYALAMTLDFGNRESAMVPNMSVFLEMLSVLRQPWDLSRVRMLMRDLYPYAPGRHLDQMVSVACNRMAEEATRVYRQARLLEGMPIDRAPAAAAVLRAVDKARAIPRIEGAD